MGEIKLSNLLESVIITNNATHNFVITNKRGTGFICYNDNDGYVDFIFKPDGSFSRITDSGFVFVKDTASSVNMYTESNDIIIQNKTGASITLYHKIRGV